MKKTSNYRNALPIRGGVKKDFRTIEVGTVCPLIG